MNIPRKSARVNSVAVIGNHLPRQCGIATFTTDLCDALAGEFDREGRVEALAMDDIDGGYAYPPRVTFQVRANTPTDYRQAVDYINVKQFDLVILQHEYGIFGGPYGAYILSLIKNLSMPVITTLHTVLQDPTEEQTSIMMDLARYSDRLVVMSTKAYDILESTYDIPSSKVAHIPHGIFDVPFIDPSFYKDSFGVEGRKVILTFGLLSPGKGIEYAIEAMPRVIDEHPDAVYIILGATHPHIKRTKGEAYRHSLQQRVVKLGIENNVMFHNRFVPVQLLVKYIGASDLYVTPYLNKEQITSGTLAYALGTGKAVVSTPYWYAEELLGDQRGVLVPFRDSEKLGDEISGLLSDDVRRNAMRKKAYQWCRPMIWKEVARSYLTLAGEVIEERIRTPKPRPVITTSHEDLELPEVDLKHLRTLTDDTGVLSYAHFATPDRSHGYSLSGNALALVAASMAGNILQDTSLTWLMQRYLAFIFHSFD
ncbi:MAG: glycosyltransferase family 4 protein, partial [Planctomycetota bacterium]